ncbi:GNAT family N-acetyltransferase [Paenibacillus sp. XY044]|uniref:GNAT family N-acetyltransferase n=1 Tax=Paenibacillus sp. XY044 TaxID=2026089 RepID=UPI000B9828B5|nr:GNAT family N-acetyltransferase [Paenibacillus sp. XY044]OZB98797.1 GNAT family N-acetyltransferase [Paenibacillus sp. XY044]
MYTHRALSKMDLTDICGFPQTEQELLYVGPSFIFPLTPEQISHSLMNRFEPTVVIEEESGQIVAYANLYNHNGHVCWLGNVIVSPSHRGREAGEFLLHAMMHKAKENYGVRELFLSCHHANSRGLAFYHKHFFRPFDLKISKLADGRKIITVQMKRNLD